MRAFHVIIEEAEDGWLAAHALEDDSVHTQGRTFDEIVRNIREVARLLHNEADVQIELIIPPRLRVA